MVPDRPVLCGDKVRYIGDPIVAVAAETQSQAEAALQAVKVDYAAAGARSALKLHWPTARSGSTTTSPISASSSRRSKATPRRPSQGSAAVVEARFQTQINHQAPLEPEATVAYWEGRG